MAPPYMSRAATPFAIFPTNYNICTQRWSHHTIWEDNTRCIAFFDSPLSYSLGYLFIYAIILIILITVRMLYLALLGIFLPDIKNKYEICKTQHVQKKLNGGCQCSGVLCRLYNLLRNTNRTSTFRAKANCLEVSGLAWYFHIIAYKSCHMIKINQSDRFCHLHFVLTKSI